MMGHNWDFRRFVPAVIYSATFATLAPSLGRRPLPRSHDNIYMLSLVRNGIRIKPKHI